MRVVQIEEELCERFLVDRGWYLKDGLWRHPNLKFGWSLDNALQLENDAEGDEDFAELVHGILRGVY